MRGLKKAFYIVINDFRGKLYLSFCIIGIPLLTLEIALTICCLKLTFSSSIKGLCKVSRQGLCKSHSDENQIDLNLIDSPPTKNYRFY